MPRNNSGEWGRQQHSKMVQVQNSGYNNYTYENYTQENYDDDGGPDYYDTSGGGILDDDYMQSSRISVSAHQPPPPERGYNRRSSNAEDYNPGEMGGYHSHRPSNAEDFNPGYQPSRNRRTSTASESKVMHGYYRGSSDGDVPLNEYGDSYDEDAFPGYGNHPPRRPSEMKRSSIDNSACGNYARSRRATSASVDLRNAREPRHHSMGHGSSSSNNTGRESGSTQSRRPTNSKRSGTGGSLRMSGSAYKPNPTSSEVDISNSESTEPAQGRHNIVNNTGRDSVGISDRSPISSAASSSMRMSATAKNNPTWFNENTTNNSNSRYSNASNSQSTEPHRNENLRGALGLGDDDDRTAVTLGTMATKAQALKPSAMNKAKDMTYPQGDVTIVYTDVQGSTMFWEACPSDMKKATDIHDHIMRQCYTNHQGYEISTEGDSFNLAFQHPADALAFALQAQLKLYKADWPEGILKHPDGKDEPALKFRGFRVRFGIHHGPTTCRVHEMTGRITYSGENQINAVCRH